MGNQSPGSAAGGMLGVETVREFQVLVNNYSAEYGRSTGGIVSAVTRSGTNTFHGSVFEFHRNDALDSKNYFDPEDEPIPPLTRNQFGGVRRRAHRQARQDLLLRQLRGAAAGRGAQPGGARAEHGDPEPDRHCRASGRISTSTRCRTPTIGRRPASTPRGQRADRRGLRRREGRLHARRRRFALGALQPRQRQRVPCRTSCSAFGLRSHTKSQYIPGRVQEGVRLERC